MTKKNIENLCRICVKESHSYQHIFDQCILDIRLYEIINDLCQLGILENDGLPSFICEECHSKLLDFKNFKKTCHEGKIALISIKMKYDKVYSEVEAGGSATLPADDPTSTDWDSAQMTEENLQQLLEVKIKEEPIDGYEQEGGVDQLDDSIGSQQNNSSNDDPAVDEMSDPGSQVFLKSEPVDAGSEVVMGDAAVVESAHQVFLKSEMFGADFDETGEPTSTASYQDPGTFAPKVVAVSGNGIQFNPLSCMRARLQHIIRSSVALADESTQMKQEEESLQRSEFGNESSLSCSSRFTADEVGSSCDGFSSSSQIGLTPQDWSEYQKWSYGLTCSDQRVETGVIGWTRSGRERQRIYQKSRRDNESPEEYAKRLEKARVYAAQKREKETLTQHRKRTPGKVGRPPKKRIFNFHKTSDRSKVVSEDDGHVEQVDETTPETLTDEQKPEISVRPERRANKTCANKILGLMMELRKSQSQEYNEFKRMRLSNESAEQRECRLEQMRERARIRRSGESYEQRELRLAHIRYQNNRRLSEESEEQRCQRLENMRKSAARRIAKESGHCRTQNLFCTNREALRDEETDEQSRTLPQNVYNVAHEGMLNCNNNVFSLESELLYQGIEQHSQDKGDEQQYKPKSDETIEDTVQ